MTRSPTLTFHIYSLDENHQDFLPSIQGKSPHQIKDQLKHLVSVHDLFYLLKSKGFFVSYSLKLILTSLFRIQSLEALKSRLLHCIFQVQQIIIAIYSESVIAHVCELLFTQLFNHVVPSTSSFSASITVEKIGTQQHVIKIIS